MAISARPDRTSAVRPAGSSAVEELVDGIRALISDEGLGVGDHLLSERELCERFSTSRNTVREAMRILKAYGVVEVRPKVGAIITDNRMERVFDLFSFNTIEVSLDTFEDIQGLRAMVEVDSAERIFAKVCEADIDELRALNRSMLDAQSTDAASAADFDFHLRLVSILDNDAVTEVYRIMKPVIIRIMELGKELADFAGDNFREHADIVNALQARRRIDYQFALQKHLDKGLKNFGLSQGEQGTPN